MAIRASTELASTWLDNARLTKTYTMSPKISGALLDAHTLEDRFRHQRRGIVFDGDSDGECDFTNPHILDLEAIFGGTYLHHFGHIVSEFVHRLWTAEARQLPVVYCLRTNAEKKGFRPYLRGVLDYLRAKDVIAITGPTIVKRLQVSEPGKRLNQMEHPGYKAFLEECAEAARLKSADKVQKVAIMRDQVRGRRLLGEGKLAGFLEQQGYEIFRSEKHSIADQLSKIYNAEQVIISDGSAGHLYDLLPLTKAKLFYFGARKTGILAFSAAPKVAETSTFFQANAMMSPDNGANRTQNFSILDISLRDLTGAMKRAGFVRDICTDLTPSEIFDDMRAYTEKSLLRNYSEYTGEQILVNELVIENRRLNHLLNKRKHRAEDERG